MEIALIIIAPIFIILWLWMDTLAILCLLLDPNLEKVQRWGQIIFVILIPVLGATVVLKFVNDHSPEVIEKFYIPWPFKIIVLNKRSRTEGLGHNGEEIPGAHSGAYHDAGGSDGGGAGD